MAFVGVVSKVSFSCAQKDSLMREVKQGRTKGTGRTFTSAVELDSDARVDVLGEIEDRLAPRLVEGGLGTLRSAVAPSS